MSGQSKQEKAAEKLYGEIGGINPYIQNRFNNYKNPYEYGDISGKIDDVYGGYEDIINRSTAEQIAKQQSGAASSLASRGITGGSVLTDTQSGIASNINKEKSNALSQLGIGKAGQLGDLMQYFNQMKMAQTKAASDVDFGNMSNLFQKFGLKMGALGGLDDDTWLDDLFGILNTAANVGKSVASFTRGGGGAAPAASDIRLKENINKVGVENGINIYEFNYIGSPKRFRGVIAQEVPQASIDVGGGILFVDYSKLGIPFEEI